MPGCTYCGRQNEDARTTCQECGTGLSATPSEASQPCLPRARWGALVVVVIGCLLSLIWGTRPSLRLDGIEITGTGPFKDHVSRALTLLKTKAPAAYATVTNEIRAIVQSAHTGMAAYENPPTSYMHDQVSWESIEAFASGIAHESLHSKLFHDRLRELGGLAEVPDGAWTGEAAEKLCCQYQARVLRAIGGSAFEISYYDWDPNRDRTNRYWEIPFEKRDW